MTTIACNRKEMACDSRTSFESGEFFTCDDKVIRIGNALLGTAGKVESIFKFIEWYQKRGDRPEFDQEDFTAVEIDKDGIWLYASTTYRCKVRDQFMSIGSGSMAAKAAMLCGLSPTDAVRIAIKCDKHSDGPVRTYAL